MRELRRPIIINTFSLLSFMTRYHFDLLIIDLNSFAPSQIDTDQFTGDCSTHSQLTVSSYNSDFLAKNPR